MHHLPIAMLDFFLFAEESLGALAGMFLELLPLNDFRGGRDLKLILFLPFPSPPPPLTPKKIPLLPLLFLAAGKKNLIHLSPLPLSRVIPRRK